MTARMSLKRQLATVRIVPYWDCLEADIFKFMNTRELTDRFQGLQKKACETAKNLGQRTDDYVRENTWSTLALAAILGCVIGFILTSSRD
jgi:hypothetical protein